jgi:hypothetical protein
MPHSAVHGANSAGFPVALAAMLGVNGNTYLPYACGGEPDPEAG